MITYICPNIANWPSYIYNVICPVKRQFILGVSLILEAPGSWAAPTWQVVNVGRQMAGMWGLHWDENDMQPASLQHQSLKACEVPPKWNPVGMLEIAMFRSLIGGTQLFVYQPSELWRIPKRQPIYQTNVVGPKNSDGYA